MADGNIGSLWMTLGLKDEVTKELKRISDTMQGVGKVTKNTKKELETLMNTPVEGKDVRWLEKIIKSLALASRKGRDLEAALEAIKQTNKGWKLLTGKVDTSKIGEYAKMIDNISTALDRIGAKKGLTDVGLSLGMRVQDVKAAMQALKSLEGEFVSASVKRKTWGWGNDQRDQYRQELNRMIKSGEEALYGKRNDTGLHEWVEKWEKKMLDAWAAADNLRKAETAGAEAAEAGRKAAEANTAALKAEEEQAKKTADKEKELAVSRESAAKSAEKQTQAKQTAAETQAKQGTARQAAVENKEFDAALVRMTGGGKTAEKINKGLDEAQKKAEATVKDVSVKLDGILGKLLGGKAGNMSIGDIAKQAAEGSKAIAELETKLKNDLKNNDAGKKASSGIREAIRNAQTFLDLVQQIDIKMRTIGEKRTAQPNVDTKKLKEATALLEKFWMTLRGIMVEGKVEGSLVMGNMPKALTATMREVQWMMRSFDKENPLSVFSGGAAKAEAALSNLAERYKKLLDLQNEGKMGGYDTSMLAESANMLRQRKAELEKLLQPEGKGFLTDKAYMTNTLSDVAVEMTKAKNAMSEYGREKGKAIAQMKAEAEEYENQKRMAARRAAANEAELKEMSDYTKRYMALVEARRKAEAAEDAAREKRSAARMAQIEKDTRRMSELYARAEAANANAEKTGMKSLSLGVDTSKLDAAIGKMRALSEAIYSAEPKTLGLGGRRGVQDYETELKNLKTALDQAVASQKELNSAQEKANAASKRKAERDAASAKREAEALERRTQSETKAAEARYNSLSQMLWKLRAETEKSLSLNVDTSAAERKIRELEEKLMYVASVMGDLKRGDTSALGKLGGVGTGRDLTLAGRTLAEQKALNSAQEKANKDKEQAIELERKHQREISLTAARVRNDLARAFEQAKTKSAGMSQTMQDLKGLLMQGGVVYGAQQFLMSVIQTGGELEKQHIALQSILGDMQNANQMFAQVKELALNSPFTFSELNADVKQLAAYGVEYDQLYDTTKRLADMSSGLGVSFERIALAFGQVQARGWLDGKELRQISYAGIPLLEKLSEYYSKREGKKVTTSEVKTRISGRGVDFEDVKNVFWEMTDAGGQFYNMQQVLSETLLGRWNKLKDAWEIMLADFASGNSVVGAGLKGIIDLVTTLVQSLHTLAPTIAMAMSGPLLAKLWRSIDGGLGDALLKSKGSVAEEIERKVLSGRKLNAVELEVLRTKRQITEADIRDLAETNALTKAELRRLMVTRKITAEMYEQGMALVQEGAQSNRMSLKSLFSFSGAGAWGKAAFGLLGSGIKSALGSVLGFFGGLPGIAISAGLAIFGWYKQKNMELEEQMKQSADELQDRYKQLNDFLKENSADKAIKSGDEKAIDNLIDEYKEKIRQIAPLSSVLYEMSADERESHEDRLKYLEAQLKMLREANKLAQKMLGDSGDYETVSGNTKKLLDAAVEMKRKADNKKDFSGEKADFDKYAENAAEFYKRVLPKLKTSATQQEAYRAMRDNLIADMGAAEEQARMMRSAIDRALGLKDMTMEQELSAKLSAMVDKTFPEIANRIRAHEELDAESKKKVRNLMKGATAQLKVEYPYFEDSLQKMLAGSNFEAVVRLIYQAAPAMGTLEKQVYDNITGGIYKPGSDAWKKQSAKFGVLKPYLKDAGDSYDKAKSDATGELDKRYKEMERRGEMLKQGKLTQVQYDASKTAYEDLYAAVLDGLGFKYEPDKSKTGGKKGGKKGGSEKDAALEELQRQISDLKAARQMYEKYKGIGMGKAQARNRVMGLFSNLKSDKISLDDYEGSVRRLMAGFDFGKSEERKKAKTSLEREMGEWEFSEKLKPEYDRVAANFKEALEKGVWKADLEKELLEKTGSEKLAAQAWKDGAVWDAHTLRLRDEFKALTGKDVDWTMADADAKKLYEGNEKAYTLWQKITQLVTDKYVKSLQQAADIMEKTATTEEKISAVRAKYAEAIELAEKNGDGSLAERYRQQRDKEENSVRTEAFKKSGGYLMFYEAIAEMGADKAQEVARQIRDNLNRSLAEGSIDAREYAKQAEQLEEQLRKLASGRKKLWEAGFGGRADWQIESGTAKTNAGLIKIGEGERLIREGKIEGDAQKVLKGEGLVQAGKTLKEAGEKLADAGREMKKGWDDAAKTVDKIDSVVQGMNSAFGDIMETAAALGADTENGGWQDAKAVMGALGGMSSGVSGVVKGLKDGDAGGVIKGAVGVITSPIKAFAAAHDAKKDREIKLAERNIKELERIEASVKTLIEGTLGGVYSYTMDADTRKTLEKVRKAYADSQKGVWAQAGLNRGAYGEGTYRAAQAAMEDPENAYKAELALTMAQRDELQRQRDAEAGKKKKDKDKLADYDEELKKMGQTIKDLSKDYLKEMYSIDMKSWASQLTDAVVSAWEKGEDAMDAYRKKAKELVKDVTKTVVSQKLMEKALEKPLEYLEGLVEQKGRLDEGDMGRLVDELTKAGDDAVYNITAVMDALKAQGYDFSESGTGSVSSSVKNITEETADVLASYLNAIRLDVSVNRANVKALTEAVKTQLPEMGQIQRAQLGQLTQLVAMAEARNEKLDRMMDWMAAVTTSGRKRVYVG